MPAPEGLQAVHLRAERQFRALFAPLDFYLPPGQLLQLIGDNGSGKSTLLTVLAGLRTAYQGRLLWRGQPLSRLRHDYLAQLLFIGHNTALKPGLAVSENLRWLLALRGARLDDAAVGDALEWFGMSASRKTVCAALSVGQRRRVALARLLLERDAKLWLLDEPFAMLDRGATRQLEALLARHVEQGGSVVMSAHTERRMDMPCEMALLRPPAASAERAA